MQQDDGDTRGGGFVGYYPPCGGLCQSRHLCCDNVSAIVMVYLRLVLICTLILLMPRTSFNKNTYM
jgi:hypothetical protein